MQGEEVAVAVRVGVLVRGIGPSYYISRFVRQQMEAFRRAGGTETREKEREWAALQTIPLKFPCSLVAHFSLHGHQKARTPFKSIFREVIENPKV